MPKKSLFFVKSLKELNSIIFDRLLYQTKALRNRLRIVTYLIKESLLNQLDKNDNIFILSLGGGSLRSIISAISELRRPDLIEKITIWNVDNDESVISLIEEVKKEFHLNNIRVKILNLNIKEFFRDFEKYTNKAFDIVELIGFLDYLPEEEVINCLNNIYSLLKNNGILICSNIAPINETRFLENLGWPPMYYRNIVDWVYILNKTYFKKATKIIKEPLSFHNIVYIQKIHNETS
jgi:SAM-dependent methyltransferase